MQRLNEVMERIGSRPALICASRISDDFGACNDPYTKDSIAVIDVVGPLSNAAWSWGGTTYGNIQEQVSAAVADPNCKGILLNVNSPGGETDMAFETAALIANANAQKPVYAVAATMAYSAAYLLASQASRVYCTEISGGVGSIGVYCAHFDYSGMLEQQGVKVTLISAGEGKTDGSPYAPLSESAKADIQGQINRLYGEFVGAVEKGRGMAAKNVIALGAHTYEGASKACSVGLADAPGDLTTAFNDLSAEVNRTPISKLFGSSVASATNSNKESTMAEIQAEPTKPEPVNIEAIVAEAHAAGYSAAAEIVELCAIAGVPAQASAFIAARKTVAECRKDLLAARVAEQEKTAINTAAQPGTQGEDPTAQGKAKPWGDVLASLGFNKKGGK